MAFSRVIARPMLASMFLVGGFNAVRNADKLAPRAKGVTDRLVPLLQRAVPQLPSDPVTLVRLNGGVQLAAGLTLASGRAPRVSALVLAASLVPTTAAGHRFWEEQDPATRTQQKNNFFKNVSMLGGLLIAAGDTEGKPGVAWRTRRVAKDARREAKHLASAARREAKLVKARAT
jgi:putative oxidoreductase